MKKKESIEDVLKRTAGKPFQTKDFEGKTVNELEKYLYKTGDTKPLELPSYKKVSPQPKTPSPSITPKVRSNAYKESLPSGRQPKRKDLRGSPPPPKKGEMKEEHHKEMDIKPILEASQMGTREIVDAIKELEITIHDQKVEVKSKGKTIIIEDVVRDSKGMIGAGTRIRVEEDE